MDDKEKCKAIVLNVVELMDDKIVGPVMDTPIVDAMERKIINTLVDWMWELKFDIDEKEDICIWSS